ncbi:MAG TPA: response regulator transcription factor [Candidatus Acidoferrum sp.]|nr:response regulator transcription factor [Candidatus Acidoferrum sp.]
MSTAAHRIALSNVNGERDEVGRDEGRGHLLASKDAEGAITGGGTGERARVYIAAENQLLRVALSRMLTKRGDIEVVGLNCTGPFRVEGLLEEKPDILLLTSRGSLAEDVEVIRQVRLTAPAVRILFIGVSEDETEFFQYVRAGIKGYLPRDASLEDVVKAMQAVHAGKAVCPGSLCVALFRFFESEATSVNSGTIQPRLGLTRREQQIVPLIAQGLTNKEIANKLCLSEQTVKNHLYRMKHKVGAGDRFGIVHLCRTQGFLV